MRLNIITIVFTMCKHDQNIYTIIWKNEFFNKKIFDLRGQTKRMLSNALGVPGAATLILPYAGVNLYLIQRIGIYKH